MIKINDERKHALGGLFYPSFLKYPPQFVTGLSATWQQVKLYIILNLMDLKLENNAYQDMFPEI